MDIKVHEYKYSDVVPARRRHVAGDNTILRQPLSRQRAKRSRASYDISKKKQKRVFVLHVGVQSPAKGKGSFPSGRESWQF